VNRRKLLRELTVTTEEPDVELEAREVHLPAMPKHAPNVVDDRGLGHDRKRADNHEDARCPSRHRSAVLPSHAGSRQKTRDAPPRFAGPRPMATPRFSVVIPTFDRREFLDQAIDSVLAQTIDDFEIVIVDDASASPVPQRSDRRIRVVRHERNLGPAAARNTGARAATGRYLTFLDDDDLFAPERLELSLDRLVPKSIVVCRSRWLDASPGAGRDLEGDVSDTIVTGPVPHVGATTMERAEFEPFDERFDALQDVEWWVRMARGHLTTTVDRVGYLIRRHETPRHRNDLEARVRCTGLLLDVHADYFQQHPDAAAYRWKRIGIMLAAAGDQRATAYFKKAFRLSPSARGAFHVMRSTVRGVGQRLPTKPRT
jgi:glycosyltransferase involved in cell wall biosynthesis